MRAWEDGHFTREFGNADELRDEVTRALHEHLLANEASRVNETELVNRARSLVPQDVSTNKTDLVIAIASGPLRSVLRPAKLESEHLRRFLMAEALTGEDAVLDTSNGTENSIQGNAIHLVQRQGGFVALDETANLLVIQAAQEDNEWRSGIPSLIEEVIAERITLAIRFCGRVLDYIDGVKRLTHVAPLAALRGVGHLPWRTRAEHQRSPNSATMGMRSSQRVTATLSPPVRRRAALLNDTPRLAEDFTVRLRRELRL